MATVINMPRLSDTMEEGVVAQWLKNVGDEIIQVNPVNPKRLVMVSERECDFCNRNDKVTKMCFIDFDYCPHTGWQFCPKCEDKCDKNLEKFSIKNEILKEKFPDGEFNVHRSNGDNETGWYIIGNAVRCVTRSDYVVTIINTKKPERTTLEKRIPLESLKSWNSIK